MVLGNKSVTLLIFFQETLVKRLGTGASAFHFNVSSLAPPSVTLLPARTYIGAPIGTNYDIRIFIGKLRKIYGFQYYNFTTIWSFSGDNPDDKPHKRSTIRMGIKLTQVSHIVPALKPSAAFSRWIFTVPYKLNLFNKKNFFRYESSYEKSKKIYFLKFHNLDEKVYEWEIKTFKNYSFLRSNFYG